MSMGTSLLLIIAANWIIISLSPPPWAIETLSCLEKPWVFLNKIHVGDFYYWAENASMYEYVAGFQNFRLIKTPVFMEPAL